MEEEIATNFIVIQLAHVDAGGKYSTKPVKVKLNEVKHNEKNQTMFGGDKSYTYSMTFSAVLPEHIHKAILGKTIPRSDAFKTVPDQNYPLDFPKTINSTSIEGLTKQWQQVVDDYKYTLYQSALVMRKVIFYDFEGTRGTINGEWDSKYWGENANLKFKYAIGYIAEGKKAYRVSSSKQIASEAKDKLIYAMDYVEWTAEREMFFQNILVGFENMITEMKVFKGNLSNGLIDTLVQNGMGALKIQSGE